MKNVQELSGSEPGQDKEGVLDETESGLVRRVRGERGAEGSPVTVQKNGARLHLGRADI